MCAAFFLPPFLTLRLEKVLLCINFPEVFSEDGLLCDTWARHTLKLELRGELQPVLDADDIPEELTAVPEAKVTSSTANGLEWILHFFGCFMIFMLLSDAGLFFAHQKVSCFEITFSFWSGHDHTPIQPA